MKIFYRQPDAPSYSMVGHPPVALRSFGVERCYFKRLSDDHDSGFVTKKAHHHTGFEIHIILEGCQTYESDGILYSAEAGSFLVIPPTFRHRLIDSQPQTLKCSITFALTPNVEPTVFRPLLSGCTVGKISPQISDNISYIIEEADRPKELSPLLIGNRILELLILISRAAGLKEQSIQKDAAEEDLRLTLAKQYITDNIDRSPSCPEIAEYCHLSEKQLTRLFQSYEGISPTAYVHRQKISRIEQLLSDRTLTLRAISEQMSFSSEYYFNAFFKKHAGLTPGAYRKMIAR